MDDLLRDTTFFMKEKKSTQLQVKINSNFNVNETNVMALMIRVALVAFWLYL